MRHMGNTKATIARYYDNERSAKLAAQKLNKQVGKNVHVVLEENDSWLVLLNINQLL